MKHADLESTVHIELVGLFSQKHLPQRGRSTEGEKIVRYTHVLYLEIEFISIKRSDFESLMLLRR